MPRSNPHENFKTKKDYTKWDNFVEQIDAIKLSKSDKLRAKKAIEYLRATLGEHFLADIIQHGHPLVTQYFINAANLARIQLIHFAESLQTLETSPNFQTVIHRLKKATKFSEGFTVLEAASKFQRAGFSVAFDIKVSFADGIKLRTTEPDIKIINDETGEEIYVEVSEVQESQVSRDSGRTYLVIWHLIHHAIWSDPEMTDFANPKHILPHIKIHRAFTEEELVNTASQIEQLIETVRKTGEFQELIIEDMIEIGISPFHNHSKAKAWALQRNITDFVEGPAFSPNELNRVRDGIRRELKQLPKDKPGIVILWNNQNLLFYLYDIVTIINEIANKIADYPNLLCVALNYDCGIAHPEIKIVEADEILLVNNTGRDLITKSSLVIQNNSFNLPLAKSTKEKIVKAFTG